MDNISINGFLLGVISNGYSSRKKIIDGSNYFLLQHGSPYKLKLFNDRGTWCDPDENVSPGDTLSRRLLRSGTVCDAEVWIDGEKIGAWRISAYGDILIERPSNINRKFVFLKEGSYSARSAGIVRGATDNGLIKIVFKPKREKIFYNNIAPFTYDASVRTWEGSGFRPPADNGSEMKFCGMMGMSNLAPLQNSTFQQNLSHGATALGGRSDQEFGTASPIYDVDTENITTIMTRLLVDGDHSYEPLVSLSNAIHSTNYPSRLSDRNWT